MPAWLKIIKYFIKMIWVRQKHQWWVIFIHLQKLKIIINSISKKLVNQKLIIYKILKIKLKKIKVNCNYCLKTIVKLYKLNKFIFLNTIFKIAILDSE